MDDVAEIMVMISFWIPLKLLYRKFGIATITNLRIHPVDTSLAIGSILENAEWKQNMFFLHAWFEFLNFENTMIEILIV